MQTVEERFLRYVSVDTQSDEQSSAVPSTEKQFHLARLLAQEMESLGIKEVRVTDTCYVYGYLPASLGMEHLPALGFIAHMDTAPGASGAEVRPQTIVGYDGGDVALGESGRTLSPREFPHLTALAGRTLITTDGTTLLGADDKAGIAEILTACETILLEKIPHGKICVGFTPDEEIGRGPLHFDVPGFGAQFAYTMDGGEESSISYENFNACAADFMIRGFNVHPGSSKDTMINAAWIACQINGMLPETETPRDTDGYEGFYHLDAISGDVESAQLHYIVRDHDAGCFESRKQTLRHIEKILNERWGAGTVTLTIRDQYRNMTEIIREHKHLIEHAQEAITAVGLEPVIQPIRGGTDGATLSYMGLPCPNLGTGGYAAHGPYEHITVEAMENCVRIILELVRRYAKE